MRFRPQVDRLSPRRRGAVALELLLVLPVFLLVLLGAVELTQMIVVEERLTLAAFSGANAARHGGDSADVETAAKSTLGNGSLLANSTVKIYRVDPPVSPATTPTFTLITNPEVEAPLTAIRVEVTAPGNTVISNLLASLIDLSTVTLDGSATLPKE